MSSIRPHSGGYNLRRRDKKRQNSPAIPGGFTVRLESPSRAASPDTTPLSSVSTLAAGNSANVERRSSPVRDGHTYSQAASRSGSPVDSPGTRTTANVASNGRGEPSNAHEDVRAPAGMHRPYQATVEEVTDEEYQKPKAASDDAGGPWIEARKGKHSGTLGQRPLVPEGKSSTHPDTDHDAPRSLNAEAARAAPARVRVAPAVRARSLSRGEGTSKRQGKTVDPRNWGNSGIPPEELDPEAQRRALDGYGKLCGSMPGLDEDLDVETQRAIYQFYEDLKARGKTRKSEPEASFMKKVSPAEPDASDTGSGRSSEVSIATTVKQEPLTTPQLGFLGTPVSQVESNLRRRMDEL